MPARLSGDRWRVVSPYLDRALEVTGTQRTALLAELSAQDPTLAADLEALLAEHGVLREEGFLEGGAPLPPVESIHGLAGSTIGSFRLTAVIGEGGSSVVFRAERSAGTGSQTVALKLLRTGLYSANAQQRFRREHAILAQLTHPNIARLIEGGVSEAGIPYIAMELVDGTPITHHADGHALTLTQRLRLFATLCRTIEAAHAALVVHRDLKPSNVLVTGRGELKVLDFGIAKLIDDDPAATRTQFIALTPGYAAPEQYGTGPITTAADVYALGVLLGELLTGKRLGGPTSTIASAAVAGTGEASTRPGLPETSPLARRLRGDLDAIIATALAEEPGLRYRSAGALADDVERYLAGQPVMAHPPSRWYRTRKFVARHRGGIAVAAIFVVGILASLAVAVWQGAAARRAAVAARAQAARADSMREFMFDAFAEAEPGAPRAGPASVIDAVERAIAAAGTDRGADPRARIELLIRLAQVLNGQGRLDRAQALLASTLAQARTELGADDPLALEAESVLVWNAVLRGELADARVRADALLPRLPEEAVELRVTALRHSANLATKQRDRARALREARLAVDLSRRSGDPQLLGPALADLGNALLTLNELPEAASTYQELLALDRQRHGNEHTTVAATEAALSRVYRRRGELDLAEVHARAAVAIDRKVYAGDHWRAALHLNALVMVLQQRRAYDEALTTETEGLRIRRATLGDDHPDTLTSLNNVGMIHALREDFSAAVPPLREALERTIARFGAEHWETATSRANFGYALAASGQRREGESELDHAIATATTLADPDPDLVAICLEKRARIALEGGAPARALPLVQRMRAAVATLPSGDAYWIGRVDALQGETLLALGRIKEAAAALDIAAQALAASPKPDVVLGVEIPLRRAAAAQALGDLERFRALATEGRSRLAALPHPPGRLTRLAASLPV